MLHVLHPAVVLEPDIFLAIRSLGLPTVQLDPRHSTARSLTISRLG